MTHDITRDVQHLRQALPTRQSLRTTALSAATAALTDLDPTLTTTGMRTLVDAVIDAIEPGIRLCGIAFAYDVVDRWTSDTDRLLIQPATARAADHPDRQPVLDVLQHQYLGVCQTRRELAATLLRLGHHWLRDHSPQPPPDPPQERADIPGIAAP